jgi:hypothetical protein
MKRRLLFNSAAISALMACGASAQVVNFHDAANNALSFPGVGYSELYAGQGAYPDPGNNIWNGFGGYGGYQTTDVYSGEAGSGSVWPQPVGNPGNPYALYDSTSSSPISSTGPALFDYATGSSSASGNSTSGSQWTPITLASVTYAGDNGNIGNNNGGIQNGAPAFLLGVAATNSLNSATNGGSGIPNVTVVLGTVPAGTNTYGLYVYGANHANDSGTTFSLAAANGGNAHNGISSTLNSQNGVPAPTFVEGQNFVIFENVTPDSSGDITITGAPNAQAGAGNTNVTGEADFNGLQIIINPLPTAVGLNAAANAYPGQNATFSFSPVFAGEATKAPGYQWQFSSNGGANWAPVGGNSNTLTVAAASALNVGLYRCLITNTLTSAVGVTPLASLSLLGSGTNVLQPTDKVFDFNNAVLDSPDTNDEVFNSVPPPFNKGVTNVFDGTLNSYESFGSNDSSAPFLGPVGFIVRPQLSPSVVTGIRIFTSGSHPEDDPSDYVLQGSTVGTNGPWVTISSGALALPLARNIGGGAPINITNQALQEIDFTNTQYEVAYQLSFNDVRNNSAASNGVQVAEVQLLGAVIGPATINSPLAPSLTEVPAGPTGPPVTLSVGANGTGPFSYQWLQNGSMVVQTGSSNSYTFTALPGTNTYTVTISGAIAPSVTSGVATVVGLTNVPPVITLGNGAGWTTNNNGASGFTPPDPSISADQLTLTDGSGEEGASAFYNIPQYIGGFIASFYYLPSGSGNVADGTTFCVQNDGLNTLGAAGGSLGYGGLTSAVGFEINIFANVGRGIALSTNGSTGVYLDVTPVDLFSGNAIYVQLYYAQDNLQVYLEDTVALTTFATNFPVNIPATVGGESAYVGFTGADGGDASTQIVTNFVFSYTSTPELAISAEAGQVVISWPLTVSSLFQLTESTNLTGPWTPVTVPSPTQSGGKNAVTLPNTGSASFYQLELVNTNSP